MRTVHPWHFLSVAGIALLSACGGGGGGPASSGLDGGTLTPRTTPLSAEEARYFVQRTCFGGEAQVQEVLRDGLEATLDRWLAMPEDPVLEAQALLQIENPEEPRTDELARWWLWLQLRSRNPLQESLAFFWHDHFATSQLVLRKGALRFFRDHVGMLRRFAAGNLRDFLHAITVDPAMLVWLNGVDSTKQLPNENFAREFWEVFSLGRDNGYTQRDVEEAARAFTGYRLVEDGKTGRAFIVWDETRHDHGAKTILGETGDFGYREVVELTLQRGQVAEFIARRLFSYYCHTEPSAAIVAELARLLREHRYELRPVLKTILRAQAMFSPRARQGLVKSPLEYVVGFMRATGFEAPMPEVYDTLLALGQVPTLPPSVFGWPEGRNWLGTQAVMARGDALHTALVNRGQQETLGVSLYALLPETGRRSAGEVVDALAARFSVRPTAAERAIYVDFLGHEATIENGALKLVPSPFDAEVRRHVDERVRGLVFLMTQHPSHHLR